MDSLLFPAPGLLFVLVSSSTMSFPTTRLFCDGSYLADYEVKEIGGVLENVSFFFPLFLAHANPYKSRDPFGIIATLRARIEHLSLAFLASSFSPDRRVDRLSGDFRVALNRKRCARGDGDGSSEKESPGVTGNTVF